MTLPAPGAPLNKGNAHQRPGISRSPDAPGKSDRMADGWPRNVLARLERAAKSTSDTVAARDLLEIASLIPEDAQPEQRPIGWAPWHPTYGWRLDLAASGQQSATAAAMRSIESASQQGWEIQPFFASQPAAPCNAAGNRYPSDEEAEWAINGAHDFAETLRSKAAPVEREPLVCDKCNEVMAAAVGLPISDTRSSAEIAEAPDDDDNTMRDDPMFNRGVQHVVDLLAKTLSPLGDWHAGDGSEDYDCDLEETLRNILAAKGLYDHETGEFASLAQPQEEPVPDHGWLRREIASIIHRKVKPTTHPHFVDRLELSGASEAAEEIATLALSRPHRGSAE